MVQYLCIIKACTVPSFASAREFSFAPTKENQKNSARSSAPWLDVVDDYNRWTRSLC